MHLLILVQNCVLVAVYVCVSWLISPIMTVFASVVGVGMLALLYPFRRRASAYGNALTENRQAQYFTVSEFLSGLKVAKSFNAEPRYSAQLAATLERMRHEAERFVRVNSIGGIVLQVSSAVGLALFVYVSLDLACSAPAADRRPHLHLHAPVAAHHGASVPHPGAARQPAVLPCHAEHAGELRPRAGAPRRRRAPAAPSLLREVRFEGVTVRYSGSRHR